MENVRPDRPVPPAILARTLRILVPAWLRLHGARADRLRGYRHGNIMAFLGAAQCNDVPPISLTNALQLRLRRYDSQLRGSYVTPDVQSTAGPPDRRSFRTTSYPRRRCRLRIHRDGVRHRIDLGRLAPLDGVHPRITVTSSTGAGATGNQPTGTLSSSHRTD